VGRQVTNKLIAWFISLWWVSAWITLPSLAQYSNVPIGVTNPLGVNGWQNGDVIYYNNGVFNRLPIGSPGYVLTVSNSTGLPVWTAGGGGGFANPMTSVGDLIVGGTAGAATRLGIGANNTVLTSNGTTASWQASSGGITSIGLSWDNVLYPTAFPNSPLTANGTLGPPVLKSQAAYSIFGNATGSSAAPSFTTPTITAGTGLTGGGNLLASPTISLSGSLAVNAGTGLTGGGALTGSPTISLSTPVSIANGGTGASTVAANTIFSNTSGSTAAPAFNALSVTAGTGLTGGGNLTSSPTVSLSTPVSVANGGTGASSVAALTAFGGSPTPGAANQAPAFNNYDRTSVMGGWSNLRSLPTSGALSGDYYNSGNWTQTGAITATGVRIYSAGTLTFNNTFTVATECLGGAGATSAGSTSAPGGQGGGLGGGEGGENLPGYVATAGTGGSFGAYGGGGSASATAAGLTGASGTYPISICLSGSGGGGGSGGSSGQYGGGGGNGGGSLYIESVGAITFASGTAITLNGGTGTVGTASIGGGGGSGGGMDVRCLAAITIASGASISSIGGAGGSGGIGGGGGSGGVIQMFGSSVTNTAGLTAATNCAGGAVGTGGYYGTAGGTGILTLNSFVQGPRSAP